VSADRRDDLRQYIDRAEPVIELAPAVVRHINTIDAELDRTLGVRDGRKRNLIASKSYRATFPSWLNVGRDRDNEPTIHAFA
jgi:hypothetical protein